MRTAVVRVRVDPEGELTAAQLNTAMAALADLAAAAGAELIENNLAALPPSRREVELLMSGTDAAKLQETAIALCIKTFGELGGRPEPGVLTYVSHGTDDDAYGVLAGFGLAGEIERTPTDEGWDIVEVTLRKTDLERVPESRIHTALEASLNCEVRIRTV
ncbi:hypothetical protein [Mycolicibacterium chitae]|nr:hypothetical protein [Mycolicibacterium chitae]MCV7107535.1 hypothetical protein [Mycolicibacterium chitae]